MRIVISNTAAKVGGALEILNSLFYQVKRVAETRKDIEWIFILNDYIYDNSSQISIIKEETTTWISRLIYDYYRGARLINPLKPDLVINMQNTIIKNINCPQFLYVHQAIPFQTNFRFSFFRKQERKLAVYQYIIGYLIKQSIKKSDHVFVQTNWMKSSIISDVGVRENKIGVYSPAIIDTSFTKEEIHDEQNKFIYPANDFIYKNHECIYKANRILKMEYSDFRIILTTGKSINDINIECVGFIEKSKLMKLYSESTLIFPSFIETVGLPLLEASLLGAIVLVADCEYSREILSDYPNAYFFDPNRPTELAALMKDVIENKIIRLPINLDLKNMDGWTEFIKFIIGVIDGKNENIMDN